MLSVVRRCRTVAGAVVAVAAAAALPACGEGSGFRHVCETATLTLEPARVVQLEGEQYLEVPARFMHGDKPVVGAELRFGFSHEDRDGTLKLASTDATGVATYRDSLDDLAFDVRMNGAFKDGYLVQWRSLFRVDGVSYCEAQVTGGSLPLDQLPQRTAPPADSTP